METFGILCDDNGSHAGLNQNGRFVFILKQHASLSCACPILHEFYCAIVNVVHGARQADLTLVDHTPQNRTALADAFNG